MQAPQTIPQYAHSTQVCEHIHTWNTNSLAVKPTAFQVRLVSRTWKSGTPTERSVPRPPTLKVCEYAPHLGHQLVRLSDRVMFQVRVVSRTWKSGLQLFYRTENVRAEVPFYAPNIPRRAVGTGSALLVYLFN